MHGLDASIIVFAVLAIFVIWKLRSVLGTRVEIEKPDKTDRADGWRAARDMGPTNSPSAAPPPAATAGPLPAAATAAARIEPPPPEAARALEEIAQADRAFDARAFLDGAQAAYAMIVEAFSRGDRATLNNFLGDEALRTFTAALDARAANAPQAHAQVAAIDTVGITAASLLGTVASVTVRFRSRIAETPAALPGAAPATTIDANDLWTFQRDIRDPNPNWKLVATATDENAG